MDNRNYEVIKIDDCTWSIEDDFVRFFLLKGKEKAMLIDSGIDIPCVKDLAYAILEGPDEGKNWEEIKDFEKVLISTDYIQKVKAAGKEQFPLELLNTHADMDHCLGNKEFDWFYLHEADHGLYLRQLGETGDIVSIEDGQVIDIGDRPLELITIPGHTHGSVAILDINHRALFPGDSVQDGNIFMFGNHRSLDDYPASIIKLMDMEDRFDVLYPSHATLKLDSDYIGKCFDACEMMLHGEVEPEEQEMHGTLIHAYNCGVCTFLIDLERVFEESDPEDEE